MNKSYWALITLLCLGAFWIWLFKGAPVDDAYILYRYSKNFMEGHGLVFNIADPVEGYACYSWVLLIALGMKLGAAPYLFARALGVASYFGIIFLLYRFARERSKGFICGFLPVFFFVMSLGNAYWAQRGMETSFYSFLILFSVYGYLKWDRFLWQRIFVGLSFCLMSMTRTEGVAIYLVVLCIDSAWQFRENRKINVRRFFPYSIGLILYGFYVLSRYRFYGYILPNLCYAKVGFAAASLERGFDYLNHFLEVNAGGRLFFIILSFYGFLFCRQRKDWWGIYSVTAGFLIVASLSGGDYFILERFLIPIHPLLAILLGDFFNRGLQQAGNFSWGWRFLTRSICFALILMIPTFNIIQAFGQEHVGSEMIRFNRLFPVTRFTGLLFKRILLPQQSISLNAIPTPAYFYEGTVYDQLGLTDRVIGHRKVVRGLRAQGHEKGDGNYILSMRPTIIIIQGGPWLFNYPLRAYHRLDELSYLSEYEMWKNPVFFDLYEPFNIPVSTRFLTFYKLKGESFREISQADINRLYFETVKEQKSTSEVTLEVFYKKVVLAFPRSFSFKVLNKIYQVFSMTRRNLL